MVFNLPDALHEWLMNSSMRSTGKDQIHDATASLCEFASQCLPNPEAIQSAGTPRLMPASMSCKVNLMGKDVLFAPPSSCLPPQSPLRPPADHVWLQPVGLPRQPPLHD
eukprot:gb/GFBE01040361.1/.p1 GENE.gb/GFBE01040361.1/~~gb/GFBE01040361.1/.p1  ORF type:complete len:109 (+),score=11.17 gb/GFBE01040361.1/:1-327(+)